MILTPHIIVGAAIGAKTQNLGLIIILGLLSHIILDRISHWDYNAFGICKYKKHKNSKALFISLIKVTTDGLMGFLIVFLVLSQKNLLNLNYLFFILFGSFIAILPDIILGLSFLVLPKKFSDKYIKLHGAFHSKKKQKEGEITFLGIATQIVVSIIACVVLLNL